MVSLTRSRRWMVRIVGGVAILVCVGCGNGPRVAKVTGKVYFHDKPFSGATVCLFPDSPDARPAEALSAADGSFALKTFIDDGGVANGVVPGRYKVGIRGQLKGTPPVLVKYTSAKSSPVKLDVPTAGITDYELRLK